MDFTHRREIGNSRGRERRRYDIDKRRRGAVGLIELRAAWLARGTANIDFYSISLPFLLTDVPVLQFNLFRAYLLSLISVISGEERRKKENEADNGNTTDDRKQEQESCTQGYETDRERTHKGSFPYSESELFSLGTKRRAVFERRY